ncbi:daptide-type RiPP biosynthesis methyltransferase [Streptomyces noursei]|uniref:daptide-type RiPP biosynthesis methyltransferase n=1 Tax=Streptomyces noursei TaxID=1971 RepID=UPI00196420BC|nr:daptide-type RiPP biosynthesis methyltransferase [Streptomyces noursei]QRX96532.1 class I SAM-dependent methyltransferase [Streptomyces noursei]
MTESARPLLGLAAKIADAFGPKLPIHDLYGPDGSQLYDRMMSNDRAEIDDFLSIAGRHRGTVLELACGNGRTTLPFLKDGYTVVGLDSSPDMLERLADRLKEPEWADYADQLTTVHSDMSDFSLGRRFDLVVLGMGTVWMLDEEQRAGLFRSVREHLNEGGRFLLTLPEHPDLQDGTSAVEQKHAFVAHDGTAPTFCSLIEYFDPDQKLRLMSILSQRIEDGEVTHNVLYAHWNHLVSATALEKEIEQTGMRVIERRDVQETRVTKAVDTNRHRWMFEVGI